MSPAYDLTYSNTYYGEHTTTVDGNGRNPGMKDVGMDKTRCERIAREIEECVWYDLKEYLR